MRDAMQGDEKLARAEKFPGGEIDSRNAEMLAKAKCNEESET
jgi:hypothetical protein